MSDVFDAVNRFSGRPVVGEVDCRRVGSAGFRLEEEGGASPSVNNAVVGDGWPGFKFGLTSD